MSTPAWMFNETADKIAKISQQIKEAKEATHELQLSIIDLMRPAIHSNLTAKFLEQVDKVANDHVLDGCEIDENMKGFIKRAIKSYESYHYAQLMMLRNSMSIPQRDARSATKRVETAKRALAEANDAWKNAQGGMNRTIAESAVRDATRWVMSEEYYLNKANNALKEMQVEESEILKCIQDRQTDEKQKLADEEADLLARLEIVHEKQRKLQ